MNIEKDDLFDKIDGFFAWDSGCVDSGIHDSVLKERIKEYLMSMEDRELSLLMAEYLNKYFTSENARSKGYGYEDVVEFVEWFQEWTEV